MRKDPRLRAYRLLLLFFPREVRRSFGDEMHELFARQHERTLGVARGRLWLRGVGDVVRHGTAERLASRRERRSRRRRQINGGTAIRKPRWNMDQLTHDVRYAWRMLSRQPGTAATIVLTLALGIGANTAVFSVVHAVLLKPLPYADPDRLVMVWEKRQSEGVFNNVVSPADFLDWQRMNRSFTGMAGYSAATTDLTGAGDPVQLTTGGVTSAFFDVLGVHARLGRTFAPGDDILGQHRVVVLGHALWQQRFGSDPQIVGRTIELNGIPQQVVGVLPDEFEFPGEKVDIWAPLVLQGGPQAPPRASHYLFVYARLAAGATVESARAEMDRIGGDLARTYPADSDGHGAHVVALRDEIVGPARVGLLVVTAAVAFLLLIACTNVANVLLARGAGRRREMAIRAAVGAARARLVVQSLTESLVIAAIGGVVGLVVALWALRVIAANTPPLLRAVGLERARLDWPVLGFTAIVCLVSAVAAGLLPAWQVTREEPNAPLREGGRSPVSLRRGLRFTLIAAEVALTVLLLVGAGLMLRSFVRVLSQPAGFEIADRVTINLTLPRSRYPDAEALRRARRDLDERFNGIPGVVAAGANNNLPLTGSDSRRGITVEGLERTDGDAPVRAHVRIVTPRYFAAAGVRLDAGRGFAPADDAKAPLVVVVNETMARRYWPARDAIGRRMRFNGENEPWRTVVGIVNDVKHWGLDREVNPEVYMPHEQQPSATLTYVLHAPGGSSGVTSAITAHVRAVDPRLPVGVIRSMSDVAGRSTAARRWSALLLGMFAGLGLLLAAAGIYGVMAHLVSMRTGEIGIRLTLGAKPAAVLRDVLGEALFQAGAGLAIGLLLAAALMRGLDALLFEVTAADPLTFVAVAATILGVALLAASVPALRAMRIDPVKAMRLE